MPEAERGHNNMLPGRTVLQILPQPFQLFLPIRKMEYFLAYRGFKPIKSNPGLPATTKGTAAAVRDSVCFSCSPMKPLLKNVGSSASDRPRYHDFPQSAKIGLSGTVSLL